MERMEIAKKFYAQAQKMTMGMAALVVAYGSMGYYLIQTGRASSSILNAQVYPFVKFGTLLLSITGIFTMWRLGDRMISSFSVAVPPRERPPQRLFLRTALMNGGAQLSLLLGLLLIFFGRRPFDFIPFAVISLVGFAVAFPKKRQWKSWLGMDF